MQAGTEASTTRKARGRRDNQGTEAVPTTKPVMEQLKHLQHLHDKKTKAAEDFNTAVKAVAEKSGLQSSCVKKLVSAKAGGNFEDVKRNVEQLALLFDAAEVEAEEPEAAAA